MELYKILKLNNNNDTAVADSNSNDIAIIGIAAKMPLAKNTQEFWDNLKEGKDCVRNIPESRKEDIDKYLAYINKKDTNHKYRKMAYLDDIGKFDNSFFNISPKEASLMDPNQRIFLETAWIAIEDAGYGGKKLVGSNTGVYVGYSNYNRSKKYLHLISETEPHFKSLAAPGNIDALIPGRVAHVLNLKGPNMLIDTACSSSLIAVNLACQEIKNGKCEQAIVGGIKMELLPLDTGEEFETNSSPDNKTKTFDDSSNGTAWGEGAIAIFLKPLDKALRDKDNVYAVIKGSAKNHDGRSISIMAPDPLAQSDVIKEAWLDANIKPETITYIEAHGTGTKLGDVIEVEGIKRAFSTHTNKKQFCAIGSAKTNIGHLDGAAGIAGLLKAVLMLKNKEIPPLLHFNKPNQMIDFDNSQVYVVDKLTKWDIEGFPRRCGVSSFGASGTNCHVVLEEAPAGEDTIKSLGGGLNLLTLSAKNKNALDELIGNYQKFFNKKNNLSLNQVCYTANTGRGHYNHRVAMLLQDKEDLKEKLNKLINYNYEKKEIAGIYYNFLKNTQIDIDKQKLKIFRLTSQFNKIKNKPKKKEDILNNISKLYVQGVDINWEQLYKGQEYKKISLPTYPFEKKRCWLEIPGIKDEETAALSQSNYKGRSGEVNFYIPKWKSISLPFTDSEKKIKARNILIFRHDNDFGLSREFKKLFKDQVVTEVLLGDEYQVLPGKNFKINYKRQEDFEKIILGQSQISEIYFLGGLEIDIRKNVNLRQLDQIQEIGVLSLLRLVKALDKLEIISDFLTIKVITNNIFKIQKEDKEIYPYSSSVIGFSKAVHQEYPKVNMICIDMRKQDLRKKDIKELLNRIARINVKDIVNNFKKDNFGLEVAFRGEKNYVRKLLPVKFLKKQKENILLKNKGVYLIIGGAGGVGFEISKYLSQRFRANIILVGRSKLNREIKKRIENIENYGGKACYYSGDITKLQSMQAIIKKIKQKFKQINGIFHLAMVRNFFLIKDTNTRIFKSGISSKIRGSFILETATNKENLDFIVFFSSIVSFKGAYKRSDYTASCYFEDIYGAYLARKGEKLIKVINWGYWGEIKVSENRRYYLDNLKKTGRGMINNEEGVDALNTILANKPNQIVVNKTTEFVSKNEKDIVEYNIYNQNEFNNIDKGKKIKEINYNHVKIEKEIAKIWSEVLGYKEIDINDNFFAIGGDSLLLVQIHGRIEKKFPGKLVPADFYTLPTIKELAEYINTVNLKYKVERIVSGGIPFTGVGDWLSENRRIKSIKNKFIITKNKAIDLQILDKALKKLIKLYPVLTFNLITNKSDKIADKKQSIRDNITNISKYNREIQDKIINDKVKELAKGFKKNEFKIAIFNTGEYYRFIFFRDVKTIDNKLFAEILVTFQKIYNLKLIGEDYSTQTKQLYTPICSYPDYYNCVHTDIPEKINWENNFFFYKSLMPALDFSCLPDYYIVDKENRRTHFFNAQLLGHKDIYNSFNFLNINYKKIKFKNKKEALNYYDKNAKNNELLLLSGAAYHLPFSRYYKNQELINSCLEGRSIFPINTSIFFGALNKDPIIHSVNLNYFGRIRKNYFLVYWRGPKTIKLLNKHENHKNFPYYEIFIIKNINKIHSHTIRMLYKALYLNIKEFFKNKIVDGKKIESFEKIYFGRQVLQIYRKDVLNSMSKEINIVPDIIIIDLIKKLERPYLFLHDLLMDISKSNKKFNSDLGMVIKIIQKWGEIFDYLYGIVSDNDINYNSNIIMPPSPALCKIDFLSSSDKKKIINTIDEIAGLQDEVFEFMRMKLKKMKIRL